MSRARQICTHCGYEGRGKLGGARKGGGVARVAGVMLMLPIYTLWKAFGAKSGKYCPHCKLPAMVKLASAEGIFAQRKFDLELGVVRKSEVEKQQPVDSFGNEKPTVMLTKKPVNPDEW